ncbi:hypothetical protein VCR4J2_20017 [Vibrio coralliirubri]|nr:hypothetical protein VCR4J2_20017 [Vibrio coralliirubri]
MNNPEQESSESEEVSEIDKLRAELTREKNSRLSTGVSEMRRLQSIQNLKL